LSFPHLLLPPTQGNFPFVLTPHLSFLMIVRPIFLHTRSIHMNRSSLSMPLRQAGHEMVGVKNG
jgi:hypothetical protein